ncbi:hypothetical protein IE81DRAFT_221405 [Ceraceosorus guamensis]|uniref:Uncharacterized protein n=1 Tax=Ceraceosorus guamensis TaxID=1522189 RepID=A0A316VSH2_9BASI|nr:hypothetical protein IE81DRAFT_221405 [Ceraceosorus guamensis]PWN40452.1 hypothetical protein IE81DRAFT_221405 [Ceraceosorus guamensis]
MQTAPSASQLKIEFIGDLAACAGSHGAQLLLRRHNTMEACPRKWRRRNTRLLARDQADMRRDGHRCPTNSHIYTSKRDSDAVGCCTRTLPWHRASPARLLRACPRGRSGLADPSTALLPMSRFSIVRGTSLAGCGGQSADYIARCSVHLQNLESGCGRALIRFAPS